MRWYLYDEMNQTLRKGLESVQHHAECSAVYSASGWNGVVQLDDAAISPDLYVQWIDVTNGTRVQSANVKTTLLPYSIRSLNQEKEGYFHLDTVDGTSFYIYSKPLWRSGSLVAVLQIARDAELISGLLTITRRVLFALITIITALAFCACWMASGEALKPLRELISAMRTARRNGKANIALRYNGPRDEIRTLYELTAGLMDRLEGAAGKLARASSGQKRLIADASHELRTPLTSIRGNSELLRKMWTSLSGQPERPLEAETWTLSLEALDDITEQTGKMSALVSDMLSLARADADTGAQENRQVIPLKPIVDRVDMQFQYGCSQVEWRTFGLDTLESVYVLGHSDDLQQLLTILVKNGFQFTAEGWVQLSAERTEDEIVISVQDTGIGMDAEQQAQLFEPFYRADASRGITAGSGLGLALAKRIAEAHQGELYCSSFPGAGSVFTFRMPICVTTRKKRGRQECASPISNYKEL
ncbi:HAMP domain-containing histidine kinase [Paenibacillus doosanensis]|nr:HAMP domain-containing histidine kinase [Paenibacillus doosanensis]